MDRQSSSQTSSSLLGRLGRDPNDAAAWGEFVRRYGRKVYVWCQRWGLQDADAEDVTQNVLLEVARKMRVFVYDPSKSFRAWLKTLAHAAWCDWLEGRRRPGQGSGDKAVLDALASVEARDDLVTRLEEEYDCELLEEAVARVRLRVEPRTWESFRLLAQEGLSGAEAAARLGMKVGTVFVAKSKVQRMLQEEMRRLEGVPEPGGAARRR
jgi:RNA polymerase sigma-70 factor (ECF subfamily)